MDSILLNRVLKHKNEKGSSQEIFQIVKNGILFEARTWPENFEIFHFCFHFQNSVLFAAQILINLFNLIYQSVYFINMYALICILLWLEWFWTILFSNSKPGCDGSGHDYWFYIDMILILPFITDVYIYFLRPCSIKIVLGLKEKD